MLLKNLAVMPKGLWLARVARQRGVDHIHAHWAGTSATVALIASVISGIPWSFTAHRWDISENNLLVGKVRAATFARVIDAQGKQELMALVGSDQNKLRLIHMGVAMRPPSGERPMGPAGGLRVVMGARFVEVKGHRYALEAIARLKAAGVYVTLHCAGHGPLKAKMEKYACTLDVLDRVEFLGVIDHGKFLTELWNPAWHVALLPSIETGKNKEGIPVFLMEAMAAGLPVVATRTGGIPELLESGAGVLIPERDANAIADALLKLATDSGFRRELTLAGIRRVQDQFNLESTVSRLLHEMSSTPGSHSPCNS